MRKISSIFFQILLGVIIGLSLGGFMLVMFDEGFFENFGIDTILYFLIMFIVSFILQIILHEAGHLLFGYLADFKFVSFRIGSYIVAIEDGKPKLGRYHLTGTGGQCLMEPSKPKYWKYLFYNLGGGLVNIVIGYFFLGFGSLSQDLLFDIFCFCMFASGLLLGLTNLIPLDLGIPNDGYNAYWMTRNRKSMQSLYNQLMISKELAAGKCLVDIDEQYFELYEHANLNNPLNLCIETNRASRLIYQGEYKEAKKLLVRLNKMSMSEIFKKSVIFDLVLIELLTSDQIDIDQYLNGKYKKMISTNKNDIDSLLCQYGIDLLIDKDEKQAQITLKYFNDVCKTYPYQGIVRTLKNIQTKIEERVVING